MKWDGRKVVVSEDEKGGMKPPAGWQDPNRGWDNNVTLVKQHVERAINLTQPQAIVWTHGTECSYCAKRAS